MVRFVLSARKIHCIALTIQEIQQLKTLIRKGTLNARVVTRARVLVMAHEGKIDKEIYEALDIAVSTPYDIPLFPESATVRFDKG